MELDSDGLVWLWSEVEGPVREAVSAEPSVLRGLLARLGVTVTLYWKPNGQRYFRLEKALLKADFEEGILCPSTNTSASPVGPSSRS